MASIEENQLVALSRIASLKGTYLVNDANPATIDFSELFVCEDTVIASLSENGSSDIRDKYMAAVGGTLKAGTIISCKNGKFTGITLTSGSVNLILL